MKSDVGQDRQDGGRHAGQPESRYRERKPEHRQDLRCAGGKGGHLV